MSRRKSPDSEEVAYLFNKLYREAEKKQRFREHCAMVKDEQTAEECPFQPNTDRDRRISSARSRQSKSRTSVHERLFSPASRLGQAKRSTTDKTFSPRS